MRSISLPVRMDSTVVKEKYTRAREVIFLEGLKLAPETAVEQNVILVSGLHKPRAKQWVTNSETSLNIKGS